MVDTVHLGTGEKPRQRSETHPQTTVQIELQCTEQGRNDSRIGRGDLEQHRQWQPHGKGLQYEFGPMMPRCCRDADRLIAVMDDVLVP